MTHRILFVCLGNICRSPSAEAVVRALAAERGLDLQLD
ncbi:MAG TPA: phosphotyrosine protein phosphatase, partial [Citreicella sp.]|nr:phosphotyrosine protein phosphatase [Citreicella sp.]